MSRSPAFWEKSDSYGQKQINRSVLIEVLNEENLSYRIYAERTVIIFGFSYRVFFSHQKQGLSKILPNVERISSI